MYDNSLVVGKWRCESYPPSEEIICCLDSQAESISKHFKQRKNCYFAPEAVKFRNDEEDWQPRSVDIDASMKCVTESGRKICFFSDDVRGSKKSRWNNPEVKRL